MQRQYRKIGLTGFIFFVTQIHCACFVLFAPVIEIRVDNIASFERYDGFVCEVQGWQVIKLMALIIVQENNKKTKLIIADYCIPPVVQ